MSYNHCESQLACRAIQLTGERDIIHLAASATSIMIDLAEKLYPNLEDRAKICQHPITRFLTQKMRNLCHDQNSDYLQNMKEVARLADQNGEEGRVVESVNANRYGDSCKSKGRR